MASARPLAFLALALALSACKEGLVEPERYGSLAGRVLDRETGAPVAGASVTTSPATGAFITAADGAFRVEDVLVGSYTISASRRGYRPNTVTVAVRDGQQTRADFFVEAEGDEPDPAADFGAEVLNFSNEAFVGRGGADSTFVTVEYRAINRGGVDLARYEVYFRIDTDRGPFYQEVRGEGLEAGQLDFGTFRKYLLGARASAVVVLDTAAREASGS